VRLTPDVRDDIPVQAVDDINQAFTLPMAAVQLFQKEAWANAHWQQAFIESTPCLTVDEADARCEQTPWDAFADMLGLPYQGRIYFPQFQFAADGTPDSWFIACLAALRSERRHDAWELLKWWLTPESVLTGLAPVEALHRLPKRVLSRARYAEREGLI
jgi:hypothetical protein